MTFLSRLADVNPLHLTITHRVNPLTLNNLVNHCIVTYRVQKRHASTSDVDLRPQQCGACH